MVSDEPLEGDDKHRVVKFDRTPVMSTYLLAMIVGEYDYVEDRDSDGVLVRVYTPVGKKEQGQFALNVRTLRFLTTEITGTIEGCLQQGYLNHHNTNCHLAITAPVKINCCFVKWRFKGQLFHCKLMFH